MMEKFNVIISESSKELMIRFSGNHREPNFPNVRDILKKELGSKRINKLQDFQVNFFDLDCYVTTWKYSRGEYEIHDDNWYLHILAPKNNNIVIFDLENQLIKSGQFIKDEGL